MIETSINGILKHAKKKKKISSISLNPIGKIEDVKKLFKKDKDFLQVIEMYEMFRKIEELKKKEQENLEKTFNLKIFYKGKEINVNLEQLKIYAEKLEKFISTTRQFLLS